MTCIHRWYLHLEAAYCDDPSFLGSVPRENLGPLFYQGSTGDCTQNLEPSLARPILLLLFVWDRITVLMRIYKYINMCTRRPMSSRLWSTTLRASAQYCSNWVCQAIHSWNAFVQPLIKSKNISRSFALSSGESAAGAAL